LNLNKLGGEIILIFFNFFVSIVLLILAINILQLKEWARKGIIYYNIFIPLISTILILPFNNVSLMNLPHVSPGEINILIGTMIIAAIVVIYFFNHPKVKEQFK